mgnify:CR=1 FL=1
MGGSVSEKLYKYFARYCVAKGIDATESRIKIQVDYLTKRHTYEEIVYALGELFGETQWFPDASLIIKKIKPSEDEVKSRAQLMAGGILAAAVRYGQYQAREAKQELGNLVWFVVERFGGWDCVCRLEYSQLSAARAQLREGCLAAIKVGEKYLEVKAIGDQTQKDKSAEGFSLADYSPHLKLLKGKNYEK